MKRLILITNHFPFGFDTGEMYLRTEIKVLQQRFDSISIIACDAYAGEETTFKGLGDNVKTIPLQANRRPSRVDYIPGALKEFLWNKSGGPNEEKINKSFAPRVIHSYFVAKYQSRMQLLSKSTQNLFETGEEIWLYSYRLFDTAYLAIKLGRLLPNVRMIVSRAHRYDLYEEQNPFGYLPYRRDLLKELDMVLPCSEDGSRYLRKRFPEYSCKVKTSLLGSSDHKEGPNPNDTTLNVISCSNVVPVKRVDLIARAIDLASHECAVRWTHIGDGKSLSKLRRIYNSHIKQDIMHFAGQLSHNDVMGIMQRQPYDIFVNVSKSEGIPQAIMEAISFGIPAVATNVGGNPEVVKDGVSGFLLKDSVDASDLAATLVAYSQMQREDKVLLRQRCRKFWESHFDAIANAKTFVDFLLGEEE